MSRPAPSRLFEAQFNHLVLPACVPSKEDDDPPEISTALTRRAIDASRSLRDTATQDDYYAWDRVKRILNTAKEINLGGKLDKHTLLDELRALEQGHLLILHVTEQNSGLLIQRHHGRYGDEVIFEIFEAAARSEDVMASKGALQWDFPGSAVALPYATFSDESFQDNLAGFLEQCSAESINRFAPRANKAGSNAIETRDTVDPAMISQLLRTLLEVHGNRVYPSLLRKKVRDDVCWASGAAERPWRRLPFWLVLRVGLSRHLASAHSGELGRFYYKSLLCVVLSGFLEDAIRTLDNEKLGSIRSKLARRLAKHEESMKTCSPDIRLHYTAFFRSFGTYFETVLRMTDDHMKAIWNEFTTNIKKSIRPLPRHAEQESKTLTLPNSGAYLRSILASSLRGEEHYAPQGPFDPSAANKSLDTFASYYHSLAEIEESIEHGRFVQSLSSVDDSSVDDTAACKALAKKIVEYMYQAAPAYQSNPEQSSLMILNVMELWMRLDQRVTGMFGLVLAFRPIMPPEALEALQLTSLTDMRRLQEIEEYLIERQRKSKHSKRTIFDNPAPGCFAERYYNESDYNEELHEVHRQIEQHAEQCRLDKEEEFINKKAEYDKLQMQIAESTCIYSRNLSGEGTEHDPNRCTKCWLKRRAKRVQITIYEYPLPSKPAQAKAVIFELCCPPAFAAYRDATWKILATLFLPKLPRSQEPAVYLRRYDGLTRFAQSLPKGVSLSSTTKSFLATHYRGVRIPASFEDICHPNGLNWAYFDGATSAWPARQAKNLSFAHKCRISIPLDSPFVSLFSSQIFAPDADGPSSNEIIASQMQCPPGVNVHEFTALQSLFVGRLLRWPKLLLELASSNINFGMETTTLLLAYVCTQAGPSHGIDPLRQTHHIFRDEDFCNKLVQQILIRMEAISTNWRETNILETLITLLLRLINLGPSNIASEAMKLLEGVRDIAYRWITQLRNEINEATDVQASQRYSRFALSAALLCKRTFVTYSEDLASGSPEALAPAPLRIFIESSITLQENLLSDPRELSIVVQQALVRDIKMTYRLCKLLQRSLQDNQEGLSAAVDNVWHLPEDELHRSYSALCFMEQPWEGWITFTATGSNRQRSAEIHYHLAFGHLLINKKPLARLPSELRNSGVLQALFGQQNLLCYPSPVIGMTHMLVRRENRAQIHIGLHHGRIILRAYSGSNVHELVPAEAFFTNATGERNLASCDLPASLMDDCFHWLNLNTGIIDVRHSTSKWRTKKGTWSINVNTRIAMRGKVSLIDPHSLLFHQVAKIFDSFEERRHLTMFQPLSGPLSVELRRLELSFNVSKRRNLWCRELRAEIDRNQDAGTWYGFASKLVLRDPISQGHRSIIVPMGPLSTVRSGLHVHVIAQPNGKYAQFTINDVLGRIDCPAESWILYRKAELHAYTSAVVCDPLTGRTGAEEALHCLTSGSSQPWAPLHAGALNCLLSIAELTPKREYYPKGVKIMQNVAWNFELTTYIQREEYLPAVQKIFNQSLELSVFSSETCSHPELRSFDSHLLSRGRTRRCIYERRSAYVDASPPTPDLIYEPRDRPQSTEACNNVFESVVIIRDWPWKHMSSPSLVSLLGGSATIKGQGSSFDKFLLSDILDIKFSEEWGSLVDLCRSSGREHLFRLSFLFATMSYNAGADMEMIRTLIAFAVLESLKEVEPPPWPSYSDFEPNKIPTTVWLVSLIEPCKSLYKGQKSTARNLNSRRRDQLAAAEREHDIKTENACHDLATFLMNQWPCSKPSLDGFPRSPVLHARKALTNIMDDWLKMFKNLELCQYLDRVQKLLDDHRDNKAFTAPQVIPVDQEIFFTGNRGLDIPSLSFDLMKRPFLGDAISVGLDASGNAMFSSAAISQTQVSAINSKMDPDTKRGASSFPSEVRDLKEIVRSMTKSRSQVRRKYAEDLEQSLSALKSLKALPKEKENAKLPLDLTVAVLQAREQVRKCLDRISFALEQGDPRVRWLKHGGIWPCMTAVTILEQLRSTAAVSFGSGMKEALVDYAILITTLQRLLRLHATTMRKDLHKTQAEMANPGHENWDPLSRPDWLLLEIDSNMLIRSGQVDVALATISPSSGSNSVLQMNMGQGKTSCIIPMVAAVLADKKRLVRVVVPKALLLQTAQLMQTRLGGLLGREVKHVPFSRRTPNTASTTMSFSNIHERAMSASGIMITLPDHILSFKLSGIQRLSDKRIAEAIPMVKTQAWMDRVCRDILDESDFTLAVRTQLIYPSGQQAAVDGHPHRWGTAEAVLSLVKGYLPDLEREFPRSIEVVRRTAGGFPLIFFLRKDVEEALTARLVHDVLRGCTSILPTQDCCSTDLQAISQYITSTTVSSTTTAKINVMFRDNRVARQSLYMLRGLLVHRILLLTLKKRWNVQYGLHHLRDPMAVPYHAKGVPSDQAEWGHPDVAILLTCLSFYYEGISLSQLRESIQHVVNSDDPSREYDRWTNDASQMPESLRDWNVVNVDDEIQLSDVWKHLRFNVVVIDHYLNQFVFPRHAKQFKVKIQASGWDIPLLDMARPVDPKRALSKPLTSGFSGTNDNRTMLPLTIQQHDLAGLSHTNAEVLTYLLRSRNRTYVLAADRHGRRISEDALLHRLHDRGIKMLIDAGAQILEMDNITVAKTWLAMDRSAKAALFFDKANKPVVVYRNDKEPVPLLASPFAENLDGCLVYLDEAHTRGTDLKMPQYAQGALTLGLGQSKDHTVQAAMRLRLLGTTQSVVFFATPEVHQSILDHRDVWRRGLPDSYDVVCWLLEQTCKGIEQLQSLYYSQGVDFCRRYQSSLNNPDFLVDTIQRGRYLESLRQTEHQTLEKLYKPKKDLKPTPPSSRFCSEIAAFLRDLDGQRGRFEDSGDAVHSSALEEVEQEREVEQEVEDIREIQKDMKFKPLGFSRPHKDIVNFAETGQLSFGYDGYEHMFTALQCTALGRKHPLNEQFFRSRLFVSRDFSKTVDLASPNDNFLRQANWILWSVVTETAVVVMDEEAEWLIPLLRLANPPLTHLLSYSAPVTKKMAQSGKFSYYSIPPMSPEWKAPQWLVTEVGLFAGRLYFDFSEYAHVCSYLGLIGHDEAEEDEMDGVEDGEVTSEFPNGRPSQESGFTEKPLSFLQEWLATRRKNQDFSYTPMGWVCQNKTLNEDHPFFRKPSRGSTAPASMPCSQKSSGINGSDTGEGVALGVDDTELEDYSDSDNEDDDEDIWHDAQEFDGGAADEVNDGETGGDLEYSLKRMIQWGDAEDAKRQKI